MLLVKVHCSDCPEEIEIVVDDLDAVDMEICACGYSCEVISVADFIPVHAPRGELVHLEGLPRRLARAA